ncbi:MAG: alpha/beta fold hydrolase [Alphaproteobacteria bacterium]|nr:alpha/beta fold hydrolase [Alphaproteobacteria bacterium]
MAKKVRIPAHGDQQIRALFSNPSKKQDYDKGYNPPLVIMAHGFPGHKASNNDLYGDLEFILEENGYDTIRFDFRGCGESDGLAEDFTLRRACEDFKYVLYWATQKNYKQFIFIGEGVGATVALMNITLNLNAIVLLWPILDLKSYYKLHFANKILDSDDKSRGYIKDKNQKYGLDFIKELKKEKINHTLRKLNVPTIIMQGVKDKIITMEHIEIAKKHMNSKRIEITTFHDGEHGLQKLNHRKMMFYHITQFIKKYS